MAWARATHFNQIQQLQNGVPLLQDDFQMSALLLPPTIAPFLTPAPLSLPFQTTNYSGHFRNPAYDLSMLGVSSKIATIAQPCLVIYPEPEKAQAENPLKSIDEKTDQGICMVTSISILFLKPELVSLCLLEIDDEGRKSDAKKNNLSKHAAGSSSVSSSVVELVPTSSPWDLLPVEIQIKIFAHCGVTDFLPLKLVCKSFYLLLNSQEQWITRQYLRQRRHGTLPSPIDSERTYTRNPEDDAVLLSDLFPPAKSAKGGHIYTFKYISGLRRRQTLCSRLCCYLADRVMDRFVHSEPAFMKSMFTSKAERCVFVQRTTARLWFHLAPLMYYTLYFLETYALARREQTNVLLRDWEAGRLPVPVPPHIPTHHCMQLLVSYLRYTVPPDEPTVSDDSWIGSLLTVSPFLRIVEYFSAEIGDGGNQRMQRKDFMHNFHNDITLNEKDDINMLVFQNAPNVHLHGSVEDVWFDVVREELALRKAAPHHAERVMVWTGLPVLFSCQDCRIPDGWRA
ncbi:Cytidylyltransferase family protein [Aspergillus niger]|uniref:Cytidylyltransferase family protein n=1 Tax=Aspergillus niger TaxID=5061 RepID=A0A505IAR6_ASPNG|nr:Cytidylyltransferase family protein [Aspergillus niger]